MSVQFRTKSQTSVDYSNFIATNSFTGCCYVYSETLNDVFKTSNVSQTSCIAQNGYFIPGECSPEYNITPSSLGCCCACALSQENTQYTKTTTLCECDSINGKWTLGITGSECLESSELCISGTTAQSNRLDYRRPRACCHPAFNPDGTAYAKCDDVCTEKECAEFAVYPYESTFYLNGRSCTETVGSAGPVINDCALSETNTNIINSCKNGTNLFCWQTLEWQQNQFGGECGFKNWYDLRFAGKFVEDVDGFALKIKFPGQNNYQVILGPEYYKNGQPVGVTLEAKSTTFVFPSIISFGTHHQPYYTEATSSLEYRFDGYFATLTPGSIPVYYSSTNFVNFYAASPTNSPIPQPTQFVPALDIVATPTFSVYINLNNTARIFGRFAKRIRTTTDDYVEYKRLLSIPDNLKRVFKVNLGPRYSGVSHEMTVGFIGQKLDNRFAFYTPFTGTEIDQYKNFIASIPAKEYSKITFTAHKWCGIDSEGVLQCGTIASINPFNFNANLKYKLVSCTNNGIFTENYTRVTSDPSRDYCIAVDNNNNIYQICGNSIVQFANRPDLSITDVTDLSCTDGICFATVEPDVAICNNQMLGSCCTCSGDTDIFNCVQTNQGSCQAQGGDFTSGGICYSENNPTGIRCDTVVNTDCTGSSSSFNRIMMAESSLPDSELTYYKDGLYVGMFEPGTPINSVGSTVNGHPQTGKAINYKPTSYGYGTSLKKWGIVVAPYDYSVESISLFDEVEQDQILLTSTFDGRWSTYGDNDFYLGIQSKVMEEIRTNSRLSGWYLPSKNELEFINYKIPHGFHIPEVFDKLKDDIYATSTPYFEYHSDTVYNLDSQSFNNKLFMYGQNFTKVDYGAIYLVPRTKSIKVRLIRRIELE